MLSRRTPHNVLGISQQQTSARSPSNLFTNFLQLNNGLSSQKQAVNIKLTDDCYQHLQKAAQNGYEVLLHVNQKVEIINLIFWKIFTIIFLRA